MTAVTDSVKRLVDLLSAEEELFVELRDALQQEQACLVSVDTRGLDEAVRQKETLVAEARMLAESRVALVESLSAELDLPADGTTLSQICDALGSGSPALRQAHARLAALVAAVRELLDLNAAFAGEAMAQVRATLQLLGRLAPGPGTYGPAGLESGVPGRLVRRSV